MGTSSAYGGPGNATPLVPTWLDPEGAQASGPLDGGASDQGQGEGSPVAPQAAPYPVPPIMPAPIPDRFRITRTNMSRFAASGGADRASLGRALSEYVSSSSGGARQAARRMGSSRVASRRLLGFLSNAVAHGAHEALRMLNLNALVGRPIEEVFLGLADFICPDGGTIDEGIARDAFIETIVDLGKNGITDLNTLNLDQMQTVFEVYASHAIETRLCNDAGTRTIMLPSDAQAAERVQTQLFDFVRRGVSDALIAARRELEVLTIEKVQQFVDQVYEQAFAIVQALGEAEAAG